MHAREVDLQLGYCRILIIDLGWGVMGKKLNFVVTFFWIFGVPYLMTKVD